MRGEHWTFLSHHGHVLLCIARDPDARLRQVAAEVGITERAVQTIVDDLVLHGCVSRTRVGRRNHYEVRTHAPLRHPQQRHLTVGAFLGLVGLDAGSHRE